MNLRIILSQYPAVPSLWFFFKQTIIQKCWLLILVDLPLIDITGMKESMHNVLSFVID